MLVVGGGPAGLEAARVLAGRGHRVRVAERGERTGGALRIAARAPGRERLALLPDWLDAECRRLGVRIDTGTEIGPADLAAARAAGTTVLLATGSRPGVLRWPAAGDPLPALDPLTVLTGGLASVPDGPVVVHDPVGGPAGVAMAEWLAAGGRTVTLVTPDQVAGTQLTRTGDLADANARLQRAGVTRALRSLLRNVKPGRAGPGRALLEDAWTGEQREIGCAAVVDCGPRLAETRLHEAALASSGPPGARRAGDCVAPRTAAEAVLEGRRRGLEIGALEREQPPPAAPAPQRQPAARSPAAARRPRPSFMSRNENQVERAGPPKRSGRSAVIRREAVTEVAGKLEGKVAFITGAARGQGRSHAVRLAQEGADIIAVDLCRQIDSVAYPMATPDDLAETVKEVEALDRRILAREADVRDEAGLKAAFEAGVAELGPVDIVLANAGIAPMALGEERHEAWQDVIDVNLTGVFNTVETAIPSMIERGQGGAIVLTSSTAGITGIGGATRGGLGYTASKHGVVGLMRSYANTLAPHSIRVNSVHPTGVRTPMVVNEVMQQFLESDPAMGQAMANALPVDMVEPVDISNAILWLVSDDGRYVTGITVPVNAGFTNKR